ncbi:MAG: hypothetical protein IPP72_15615 [Chitinophagaceae bacterium]|nr:hypothetical protein [Chitinophagaceae bacterium]
MPGFICSSLSTISFPIFLNSTKSKSTASNYQGTAGWVYTGHDQEPVEICPCLVLNCDLTNESVCAATEKLLTGKRRPTSMIL